MKQLLLILITMLITSCSSYKGYSGKHNVSACPKWEDNVNNPANLEYVKEIAFNEDIPVKEVTQDMFNRRYIW